MSGISHSLTPGIAVSEASRLATAVPPGSSPAIEPTTRTDRRAVPSSRSQATIGRRSTEWPSTYLVRDVAVPGPSARPGPAAVAAAAEQTKKRTRCAPVIRRTSRDLSFPGHGDELVALVRSLLGLLEHGADAAPVHLVVDHARFERCPLLGQQRVLHVGPNDGAEDPDHSEVVLRVPLVELL